MTDLSRVVYGMSALLPHNGSFRTFSYTLDHSLYNALSDLFYNKNLRTPKELQHPFTDIYKATLDAESIAQNEHLFPMALAFLDCAQHYIIRYPSAAEAVSGLKSEAARRELWALETATLDKYGWKNWPDTQRLEVKL